MNQPGNVRKSRTAELVSWLKRYAFVLVALIVYVGILHTFGGLFANGNLILIHILLTAFVLVFWLGFFSQFCLPVTRLNDRMLAFERLLSHMLGTHGPHIFIQDGEKVERKGEEKLEGAGVVWIDAASAVLLRTPVEFTRAVGPGVVFTDPKESIAGAVDLHARGVTIGPWEDEDPFAPRAPKEKEPDYKVRQARRFETQTVTRDGHEVTAHIEVVYHIDANFGDNGTGFGYNALAVQRAVRSWPVLTDSTDGGVTSREEWERLPVYLAANLWREMVRKFTLDDLFKTSPNTAPMLPFLIDNIFQRLSQNTAPGLGDEGQPISRIISQERIALQEAGLRVLSIRISNLHFKPEIEEELIKRWGTSWLRRAREERDYVNRLHAQRRAQAARQARLDYVQAACQLISRRDPNAAVKPTGTELLTDLINGHLQQINGDAQLSNQMRDDVRLLEELKDWVSKNTEERAR
jgi:hypothetical protein